MGPWGNHECPHSVEHSATSIARLTSSDHPLDRRAYFKGSDLPNVGCRHSRGDSRLSLVPQIVAAPRVWATPHNYNRVLGSVKAKASRCPGRLTKGRSGDRDELIEASLRFARHWSPIDEFQKAVSPRALLVPLTLWQPR